MGKFELKGAFTALVTPFSADGESVDWQAYERLIEQQISGGISGLVPCGTTGESPTLTLEEHEEVIRRTCEMVAGRVPVLAGAGSNDTRASIRLVKSAFEAGADAVMVVAPYYNKPSQEGLFQHAKTVAAVAAGPVVLYNVPARTVVGFSVDTLCRIAEACDNVVGLKDASNNVLDCQELTRRLGDRFAITSGDDALTVPLMSIGARGVISVTSNLLPAAVSEVVAAALKGDFTQARALHLRLLPIHGAMFCAPSPGPIKFALATRGTIQETVRLPQAPISEQHRALVRAALAALEAE